MSADSRGPLIAEGQVATARAGRYLTRLCEHLKAKEEAHPGVRIHVKWTEAQGTIDFGWGRCTMRAAPTVLTLSAEAGDGQALDEMQEFITRHLEKFGASEGLRISWGGSAASADRPSAETMRDFHRRFRT